MRCFYFKMYYGEGEAFIIQYLVTYFVSVTNGGFTFASLLVWIRLRGKLRFYRTVQIWDHEYNLGTELILNYSITYYQLLLHNTLWLELGCRINLLYIFLTMHNFIQSFLLHLSRRCCWFFLQKKRNYYFLAPSTAPPCRWEVGRGRGRCTCSIDIAEGGCPEGRNRSEVCTSEGRREAISCRFLSCDFSSVFFAWPDPRSLGSRRRTDRETEVAEKRLRNFWNRRKTSRRRRASSAALPFAEAETSSRRRLALDDDDGGLAVGLMTCRHLEIETPEGWDDRVSWWRFDDGSCWEEVGRNRRWPARTRCLKGSSLLADVGSPTEELPPDRKLEMVSGCWKPSGRWASKDVRIEDTSYAVESWTKSVNEKCRNYILTKKYKRSLRTVHMISSLNSIFLTIVLSA